MDAMTLRTVIAVILAAVASMVVGMLLFSPFAFGKTWMRLTGLTEEMMRKRSPLIPLVGSFLSALVLAFVLSQVETPTFFLTLVTTVWLWIAFSLCLRLPHTLSEGRSWKLFLLYAAYDLLTVLVMRTVISAAKWGA